MSRTAHSAAELSSVRNALWAKPLPGTAGSGIDVISGQFSVDVFLATKKQQRELDRRFGKGIVRLVGRLVPID